MCYYSGIAVISQNAVYTPFYYVLGVWRVKKSKVLICASTNDVLTF